MYATGDGDAHVRNRSGDDAEDLATLLGDPHCRYLLDYLRSADGPVPVSTLARHVVAGVTNTPPSEVSEEVRRRVATWLHHGQLPALAAHDVVDFDAEAAEVSLAREGRSVTRTGR